MRERFDELEPRERVMVVLATVVVVFAILWFLLWVPLAARQATLASSVSTWERALADLRPLKAAVAAGDADRPLAGAGQSLVVIVDTTLSRFGLSGALQRSQPTGQNGIRVEFENAAFDDLVRWMGALSTGYGLQVESASFSVSSQNAAGRVNASLTLQR